MKKNIKKLIRSRRGVTIAEVAIALVIISIISGAALSLVMGSVKVESQSFAMVEVENAAKSTLACFRYAGSQGHFIEALRKTAPYEMLEATPYDAPDDVILYYDGNGYSVRIVANFTDKAYYTFTAFQADGEELYSFRYPNILPEGGEPS